MRNGKKVELVKPQVHLAEGAGVFADPEPVEPNQVPPSA